MALNDTSLFIVAAKIPATFKGTPQQFADAMVRRMKIVSPTGTSFIFTGDSEPTSNVGPWLRGGTKWYVFDEDIKRYVPLDISDSETQWFQVGPATPTTGEPPVWLRSTRIPTDDDPSIGSPIGWYVFDGTNWVPYNSIVLSGTTANRPSEPVEYQQYYDTTISCLIWWERSQWRTVSGVPGDTKFVMFTTLTEAKTKNPGWEVVGAGNQQLRGRYLVQAAKDAGGSPETVLNVDAGLAQRAAFQVDGETIGLSDTAGPYPYPPTLALWCLVKN